MSRFCSLQTGKILFLTLLFVGCGVFAQNGTQYVPAYNAILKGIQDRGSLLNEVQVSIADKRKKVRDAKDANGNVIADQKIVYSYEKVKGDSVTQENLNVLRGATCGLLQQHIDFPTLQSEKKFVTLWDKYYKDKGLTKIPREYTSMKKTIFSNSFIDAPLFWIHFSEIIEALNKMKYRLLSQGSSAIITKYVSAMGANSFNPSFEDAKSYALDWYYNHIIPTNYTLSSHTTLDNCIYSNHAGSLDQSFPDNPFFFAVCWGRGSDWCVFNAPGLDYTLSGGRKPDVLYSATTCYKQEVIQEPNQNVITNISNWVLYLYTIANKSGLPLQNYWYSPTETEGYLHSLPSWGILGAGYTISKMFDKTNIHLGLFNYIPVSASDPEKLMDSNDNDVVLAGCLSCKFGDSFRKRFSDAGMTVQIPMGVSSGWITGLKVFSYLTNCQIGDWHNTHHSLDTYIISPNYAPANGTEPDGNDWEFTLVQRPRGAQVLMAWLWEGSTKKNLAVAVNGNTYTMSETVFNRTILFQDGVSHVFNGGLVKCTKMEEDELLEVVPPAANENLSITYNTIAHQMLVISPIGKAEATFNTDNVCVWVEYYIPGLVPGTFIPDVKLTWEKK